MSLEAQGMSDGVPSPIPRKPSANSPSPATVAATASQVRGPEVGADGDGQDGDERVQRASSSPSGISFLPVLLGGAIRGGGGGNGGADGSAWVGGTRRELEAEEGADTKTGPGAAPVSSVEGHADGSSRGVGVGGEGGGGGGLFGSVGLFGYGGFAMPNSSAAKKSVRIGGEIGTSYRLDTATHNTHSLTLTHHTHTDTHTSAHSDSES